MSVNGSVVHRQGTTRWADHGVPLVVGHQTGWVRARFYYRSGRGGGLTRLAFAGVGSAGATWREGPILGLYPTVFVVPGNPVVTLLVRLRRLWLPLVS